MISFNPERLKEALGEQVVVELVIRTDRDDLFTSERVFVVDTIEELADELVNHVEQLGAEVFMKFDGIDGVELN